jgi:hypothetical protein
MTGGHARRRPATLGIYLGAAVALSLIAAACGGASPQAAGSHRPTPKQSASQPTTTPAKSSVTTTSGPSSVPTTGPDSKSQVATTTTTTQNAPANRPVAGSTSADFKGIYEFAGGNSAADAGDADLTGVDLVYYWSQIEPEKGVFDWSQIQSDMAPWIAAGKKVILRVSTAGAASWDPPYSGDGTPAWVYADGARAVSDSGETIPVYWDQAYLTDYQSFVQTFGAEFDGNRNVAFIQAGIGMGAETLPETNVSASGVAAWESDGYADPLWLSTVETIASFYKSAFRVTPVDALVDRTFFDGSGPYFNALMAWFRGQSNWGLQDDGLTSTQTLGAQWSGPPLALEQLNSAQTSGDCLCADISNGLDNLHGSYLLLYKSDIDNPADAAYLSQAAAQMR